ncbi:hypothetical protein PHAVU_001G166200 [Phaseolus vulgaris]|uniref:ABC-2 type transporter domain-containing protein n=1 Tax=Phaseolus vulgaris TaxID=3885 RepID=V7CYZ0_PHAVU|nr:hypothetical protein PHAVU_001G166200g [Phaseolus vulgaris]ESW34608.1 hypothetical protein PHAVU_001G166200g [Phaseolus vulgaris]
MPDPDIDAYMKAVATEGQKTTLITDYVLRILGLETCADTVVGNTMLRASLVDKRNAIQQGPREYVLQFFQSMGFQRPERKGVADFLQEVTSRNDQEQYWAHKDQPYRFVRAKEFSEALKSFHVGRSLREELDSEFDRSKSHPAALNTKKFGVGKWELLKACLSSEYLLMKRNSFVYIFRLSQVACPSIYLAVMAFIAMTIFLRTKMCRDSVTDGGIYVGALFFGLAVIMFNGLAELPMVVLKLPVFYKQRDNLFFPSWAYALPAWILKIPMTFVEVAVWLFLTYYVIGFDPNIGRQHKKKWWLWGFWISPKMYGQNAMVNNEFLAERWRYVLPNSSEPLGVEVLKSRGFFIQSYWIWIGVVVLIGYTLLFNFGYILSLTYMSTPEKRHAFISEEPENNEQNGGSNKVRNDESICGNTSSHAFPSSYRGMVLPFEPHSITFDDVTYAVDMPQEMRNQGVVENNLVLLKCVSGSFRPGVGCHRSRQDNSDGCTCW